MSILIIHPILQATAIFLALFTAYLGFQRTRSLHFGKQVRFNRNLHAAMGSITLLTLLAGLAGGVIIASRFVANHQPLESIHGKGAMVLLPFMLIGIFTGFYLYVAPPKGKILSIIHGLNNVIILFLLFVQAYTGLLFISNLTAG